MVDSVRASEGESARPSASTPAVEESNRHERVRRTDGGRRGEGERLRSELEQLEQDPKAYETREQAVIDRYERVLAEHRERQRKETGTEPDEHSRLGHLKTRLLRLVGLR